MSLRILAALALALLSALPACHRSSAIGTTFTIYTLRDTTLSVADAATRDLGALDLAPTPLMTASDIAVYSWSQHRFSVRPDVQSRLVALGRKPYKSGGIPFVVVVGNERVYLGAFWYGYSSSLPRVPYVMLPLNTTMQLRLEIPQVGAAVDSRGDRRVHDSLRRAGVLVE
jgi:hypothetical protein